MFTNRLVIRQIVRSRKQAAIFVLCVMLSMVTLTALGGFSASVDRSMLDDARALHAGDVIIRSHYPFSAPLLSAVIDLQRRNVARGARIYQFYSVVRVPAETRSLLADLKVVEPGYPWYGTVELASRRPLQAVLVPGTCVVEATLLERLRLQVGHRLLVGRTVLTIVDVVVREPDRPINLFALGPRILIGAADLEALDLIQNSSRVHYVYLLKVPEEGDLPQALAGLRRVAGAEERIETFRTAPSRIKRFFDNFLFFLSLISIFTMMLAGIGIQSSLLALLKENEKTIAIMKTLGATSRFVRRHYLRVTLTLGGVGTLIGLGVGLALQQMLPRLFAGLIPPDVTLMIPWRSIGEGLALGLAVVTLFTFIPLQRLRDLKPNVIFRKEPAGWTSGSLSYLAAMAMALFFCGLVLWRLRELRLGLYFVGGVIGLVLLAALATEGILRGLKRRRVKSLPLRQALKGLFRPRNATRPTIITLTTSLAVVFAIYLVERNLDAAFIHSYPADAPNLFFIDIQPAQVGPFSQALGQQTEFYPIIRARLNAINGRVIDQKAERQRRGDNLAREFNLTYRNHLLEDEVISKGSGLFRRDWNGPQVSVLDTVVKIRPMEIGDRLTFNIQGVPLEARIGSIRSRTRES
ncbi:MAG: FtsX-like permease family protein, partial [Desulfobacterales bacterium]|nr:FtsX-like permease family protein [Desulfobacterales bacterium]